MIFAEGRPRRRYRARTLVAGAFASISWLASIQVAYADEPLSAPQPPLCEDLLLFDVTPARHEWAYWVSGGWRSASHDGSGASVGVGGELTWSLATLGGFPAGVGVAGRRLAELRVGPWLAAATRTEGGLLEGGLKVHWGAVDQSAFGTFELRLGAGVAAFYHGPAPTLDATLLWGTRSVLGRYRRRSPCEPRATAKPIAESSVLRFFFTQRTSLSSEGDHEFVMGIELSPSLLLSPYSWRRVAGGDAR